MTGKYYLPVVCLPPPAYRHPMPYFAETFKTIATVYPMDLSEPEPLPDFIAIPEAFYSFAAGKPFDQCICCETYLLEEGTSYVIEKAVVQYLGTGAKDVAFEYAMCLSCVEKMRQALSKASLARMQAFFQERVDFAGRRQELIRQGRRQVQDWLQHCLVSHAPMSRAAEYQLFAQCDGTQMLLGDTPYMLCGQTMAELQQLLSPETKEVLDGFVDQYFGLPPEWKELVKERNLLFI